MIKVSGKSIEEAEVALMLHDLNNIREWLLSNRLCLNLVKTEYLLNVSRCNFSTFEEQPRIVIGIKIYQFLTWNSYIDHISKKMSSGISAKKKINDWITDSVNLMSVHHVLVQPHFDYCCEVWNAISRNQSERTTKTS
jgi:hypothetical protein